MTASLNKKIARLSPAARNLLDRVLDPLNFYAAFSDRTPKAMQELIDAKLVGVMDRVVNIKAYYVPRGAKPLKLEQFPRRLGR